MEDYVKITNNSAQDGADLLLNDTAIYKTACKWLNFKISNNISKMSIIPNRYLSKEQLWIGGIFPYGGDEFVDMKLSDGIYNLFFIYL